MQHMPQIEPITSIKRNHLEVIDKLDNGPIFLAQRSKGIAVLLSTGQWELINQQLDEQASTSNTLKHELHLAVLRQRKAEMDNNPAMEIPWSEVEQRLNERELLNV